MKKFRVPKAPTFKIPKYKEPKPPKERHVITPYEKDMIKLLCPAVKSRTLIEFWYEDTTKKFKDWRMVMPHLIGENAKTGYIQLVAWFLPTSIQMLDGESEGWRLYNLENISQVNFLNKKFRLPQFQYNPNDSRMSYIYCAT